MNVQNIRPQSFDEFVGKDLIKNSLKTYIEVSKKKNIQLGHILFYGLAGNGKTSLASIIAKEFGTKIHYIQGPSIKDISDVLDLVSMVEENDIVFIDEIHNVDLKCMELFYSILEDFVVDIKIGKDLNSQYNRLLVPKFTLIGSTTNLGKLPEAFVERFPLKFYLDTYLTLEILEILKRINNKNDSLLNEKELKAISRCSKGVPRLAINLYRKFSDYRFLYSDMTINEIFNQIGIYTDGLEEIDLKYLQIIYNNFGKPIGIKSLCQALSLDTKTIELKIEPYLLRQGYIIKKTNGRALTSKGFEFVSPLINKY